MKIVKKIIIRILSERFKSFLRKFRKYNALNSLDKKLLKYLNFKDGFYIECGAYDGVNQSNTWYFEKNLNWKGVLIEPNKKNFSELKKNKSSKKILIILIILIACFSLNSG
jgi:hypothetical protein